MKLLTLADLHLDYFLGQGMNPLAKVPQEHLQSVTHCILAGDLSNKGQTQWKRCLPWLAERLPNAQVFVMPGNHDYYDGCIDRDDKLRDAAAACDANFVQKSELIFGQHRFLCCTLWTDFRIYDDAAKGSALAVAHMNDYRYIRVANAGHARLKPAQTMRIHMDHREWLVRRLSQPFDGETTVITHHAPHRAALEDLHKLGACYASDLEPMIKEHQPARWLFGHTHHAVAFDIGQTRLQNISVGYPGQFAPLDTLDRFTFALED